MREFVLTQFGQEEKILQKATELNHKTLCLVYNVSESIKLTPNLVKKLKISFDGDLKFGLDIKERKYLKNSLFDVFLQLGTSKETVFRGINYIYNNENEEEKDFIHQRRSGLNHVILADLTEKGVGILFSYSELQKANAKRKSLILGRIMQNIKLCKKYKVNYSFACLGDISSIRSKYDVSALDRLCL